MLREAYPRVRCHRTLRPRGTLAWRTAGRGGGEGEGGQGLCVGLDVSLLEVVGVWLITCEGVGVVKRVHTLSGGVHRLATALKEVEEVRKEVQEIKDEWEDEEVEENWRTQGRRETLITCVDEMTCATPLIHAGAMCES